MRTLQKKQERTVGKLSYRLHKSRHGHIGQPQLMYVGELMADPRDWGEAENYLFIYLARALGRDPESAADSRLSWA